MTPDIGSQCERGSGRGGGMPTKISRKLIEAIGTCIGRGNYIETACLLSGIARTTLYNWRARAQAELDRVAADPSGAASINDRERLFVEFLYTVQRALSVAIARDVAIIRAAAENREIVRLTETRVDRTMVDARGYPVRDKEGRPVLELGSITTRKSVRRVPGDWRAAAWHLERRQPERYGRPRAVQVAPAAPPASPHVGGQILFYRLE